MNKIKKTEPTPVTTQIWSENADIFMRVRHTSQERVLHPYLADRIMDLNPDQMLDFGCGDTRLLDLVPKEITVDAYDKNPEMLEIAKVKNGTRIRTFMEDWRDIPRGVYDVGLLSMVLMTISDPIEHQQILRSLKDSLRDEGKALIAITHPCFRDRIFSNVITSFHGEQPYQYLKEGQPFTVRIEDQAPPSVAFVDFHWTLSFTINEIVKAGLEITRFDELGDDAEGSGYNPDAPLFIVITTQKKETR